MKITNQKANSKPLFKSDLQHERCTALFKNYDYLLNDIRNTTQGIKAIVEAFHDGKRVHKDTLCLTSSKSRKTFAREAGDAKVVLQHLLQIEEQLAKEFSKLSSNQKEATKKELTAEETVEAKEFLKSPQLMFKVVEMVHSLGVVGEEAVILMHYLTFTSRITAHPLSVVVKGDSSSGKSYVLSKTLQLIPPEAYEEFTDATGQSFYYAAENAYSHKIIVIFEKEGAMKTQNSVRSFQSEGKLRIQVTIKNPETNQLETVVKEVKGPVGIITTTTNPSIHAENETRCFSIFPNESQEQTQKIFTAISKKYQQGHKKVDEKSFQLFYNIQRVLKPYPVIIPFIEAIEKAFPKNMTRVRRDYERFLALIEVSALLHQEQRQKVEDNGIEKIVAVLTDYGCAWYISQQVLTRTIYGIAPKTERLLEVMREIEKKRSEGAEYAFDPITVNDLAKELEWDADTVYKWLKPAVMKGFVEVAEESRGRIAAKYKLSKKELQKHVLPDAQALIFHTQSEDLQIDTPLYNPLTGESS